MSALGDWIGPYSKNMLLTVIFLLSLVAVPYLWWNAVDAENSYYEGNDLCDSDDEDLRQMCEDDRATWKMYELAWKGTCGLGILCLLGALLLPKSKPPQDAEAV
tara:strand:+ start:149 stop:460 length:312 start_codon:yes stop_codon:yes gene_type:complete